MRLWSLHPQYLDPAGLVALWREGLLAQAVLLGKTRGYTRHPQLLRFQEQQDPVGAIAAYLHHVALEAEQRHYKFDRTKLSPLTETPPVTVTDGQLLLEWRHLKAKLRTRSPQGYRQIARVKAPLVHPGFVVVPGPVAAWERAKK